MLQIPRINLAAAEKAATAAVHCALGMQIAQNIAIVDESGQLVLFKRMDDAKFIAGEIAINKAFTAAGSRKPTEAVLAATQPGAAAFGIHCQHAGRFTTLAGGIPLMWNGVVVGAIGVSAGTLAQDQEVAEAGVAGFVAAIKASA